MKPRITLLIAASALPLALALPVVSGALASTAPSMARGLASTAPVASAPLGNVVLASNGESEGHEGNEGWFGRATAEHEGGDGGACTGGIAQGDDEEGCTGGAAAMPAPGSVAPPANGLFDTTGNAPAVQVN